MLNRRYLRIKVMQALYAFFQSDNKDMGKGEREMFHNIEKIYDLYIIMLLLLIDIRDVAENSMEDAKNKKLPTSEDLDPNTKFIENRFIKQLAANQQLLKQASNRKVSWQNDMELVKKVFNQVRSSAEYGRYMNSSENSYKEDAAFVIDIYKRYIAEFELLEHHFEEKSIYWADDFHLVNAMVVKTIQSFEESRGEHMVLMPLYKDEEEDRQFIVDLYRKTILHDKENEQYIGEKTQNWEVERIAMMDVLLMKMAITEILNFSSIPVKVTLNEYIEISKLYSTPKSKGFINGILDKLVIDFKEQQKFRKAGRGLIE
jgi:transcription antitermination protein NusB